MLLGVVLLIRTPKGAIEIELSDPEAKVTVAVDGNSVDITGLDKPLSLVLGKHDLTVKGEGYETVTKQFTVTRGKNAPLLRSSSYARAPPVVSTRAPSAVVAGRRQERC